MRILAMDVGDRRIGLAVSDLLGWTAQGLETLERRSNSADFEKIGKIIKEYNPEKIVLGLPRNMNGTLGPQGEKVQKFGESLGKIYDGDIVYWDERLTTVSANRIMIDADISRQKRKKQVDRMAAVFILQGYLDHLSIKRNGE